MGDGTALSNLAPASFGGQKFEFTSMHIRGGQRYHLLEYRKRNGGRVDRQGRRPYAITFDAWWHENISLPDEGAGFPMGFDRMLRRLEKGETDDLYVPSLGVIRAFCHNWDATMNVRVRSGMTTQLEFIEDSEEQTLEELAAIGTTKLDAKATTFEQEVAALRLQLAAQRAQEAVPGSLPEFPPLPIDEVETLDLVDSVVQMARDIESIRDQADLYGSLMSAKVESLIAAMARIERTMAFQQPENWSAIKAGREMWSSAVELSKDLRGTRLPLRVFEVPRVMSIQEISLAIFGDTSHGFELLMNQSFTIDDPMVIQPGTQMQYFAEAG
jgi:hypothetical protein